MQLLNIMKALNNQARLDILMYLKNPQQHFKGDLNYVEKDSVCVGIITKKLNLSQSTVSTYMSILENVGLVCSQRKGKWTYYRRNNEIINRFIKTIKQQIGD